MANIWKLLKEQDQFFPNDDKLSRLIHSVMSDENADDLSEDDLSFVQAARGSDQYGQPKEEKKP